MVRRQSGKRLSEDTEDPMAGTANLVDAMLVIAVGLLVFLVISWNMQGVVFSDMTQEEKQNVMQQMSQVSELINLAKDIPKWVRCIRTLQENLLWWRVRFQLFHGIGNEKLIIIPAFKQIFKPGFLRLRLKNLDFNIFI